MRFSASRCEETKTELIWVSKGSVYKITSCLPDITLLSHLDLALMFVVVILSTEICETNPWGRQRQTPAAAGNINRFFFVFFFQVRFGVNQMLTLAVSNSNSTDNISTINPTYWLGANTAIAVVFILIIKTSTYSAFKLCVDLPMMQSSCLCFLSSCISFPSDSDWTKTRSGVYNWISLYQNGTFDILLLLVPVILLIRVLRHVTKTMECEIIQRT